jgi:hypothetical protein
MGVNLRLAPNGGGAGFYWVIPILLCFVWRVSTCSPQRLHLLCLLCAGLALDYDVLLLCRVYEHRQQGLAETR